MGGEPFAPGALVAGKLRVVRQLGAGGMGAVYEVEHVITKHHRALKVLLAGADANPGIVQRFLREASAAGHIGNPHIVETFDAGTLASGEPYIVMELLDGEPLSARIARGPLPLEAALEIVLQAANGLQAAHDAGVVHRDIKPDNLFLLPGEPPFLKILDFGISKFDPERTGEAGLTRAGSVMGTPWYMSPEQVRGDGDIDARADVYALGVVLYECVTGRRPFEAKLLPELAVKIHEGEFAKASTLADVHQDLDELLARAMHKDRTLRFESATELGHAIEELGRRRSIALQETVYAPSKPATTKTVVLPEAQAATDSPVSRTARPVAKRAPVLVLGAVALVAAGIVATGLLASSSAGTALPAPSASIDSEPSAVPSSSAVVPAPSNSTETDAALPLPTPSTPAHPPAAPAPSHSTRSQQHALPSNPF